jgi:serine/threonine protein kinase
MDDVPREKIFSDNLNPLPVGTHLQEFVVEKLVGIGGFGIVYQANDTLLGRNVAIKEYMPTSMASRPDGATVSVRSEAYTQDFESGKRSFINEARMLARFKHGALIEVFRFWEQNGTAYMAMPFYEGQTLKEILQTKDAQRPDQEDLLSILHPIFDALEMMHEEKIYHRDISPDNIMVLPDGRPILLDLGAARKVMQEGAQALTVMVKPGYAPIEQYADDATVKQGPWTDIYAIGAVINFAITGKAPPQAASRLLKDSRVKLQDTDVPGFTPEFLSATDVALRVRPEDRPQSISEFRKLLMGEVSASPEVQNNTPLVAQESIDSDLTIVLPRTVTKTMLSGASIPAAAQIEKLPSKSIPLTMGFVTVLISLVVGYWYFSKPNKPEVTMATTLPAVVPAPAATPAAASPPIIETPIQVEQAKMPAPEEAKEAIKALEKPVLVRFNIKPWGEVFVDGTSKGVSPPMKSLSLAPGEYSMEIRNGDFATHATKVVIKTGASVNLNHVFGDALQAK